MTTPTCRKCAAPLPADAIFCHLCGVKQAGTTRRPRTRPNGAGTAYKRGKTWTARVVRGWKTVEREGKVSRVPAYATKGGFATKREALEYCHEMKNGKARKAKALTFADIYSAWEDVHKGKISQHTLYCYQAAKAYYDDLLYLPFGEIQLDDWQECVDNCPKGKRTKENMRTLAGLLYKYALPRHQAEMNYAQFIDVGSGEKGTHPAFTDDQVEIIRKAIGKVDYADYIYILIYTGFRPGELLSMAVDAFNAKEGTLTGGSKTEAGRNRVVTLSPRIISTVEGVARKASSWLFPRLSDGARMDDQYFREDCFYPALDAMGIQPIPTKESPAYYVPYSCRHTFANLMKKVAGADVDKAALMGHSNYDMTKYYQSADLAAKRAITDAL